jgi:rubrerythrin
LILAVSFATAQLSQLRKAKHMAKKELNEVQLTELLLQSLEHERGGINVYENALQCVVNEDLQKEWQEYLEQTRKHERKLTEVCQALGIDPEQPSPGREIIGLLGEALVHAIEKARAAGNPEAAQLVACECVVLAETKDHLDWELIGKCAEQLSGNQAKALMEAFEEIEEEEDEHLYHSTGWCRELWIESLGMRAVLPPPEERKDVKTAIGAARAEQARDQMR